MLLALENRFIFFPVPALESWLPPPPDFYRSLRDFLAECEQTAN